MVQVSIKPTHEYCKEKGSEEEILSEVKELPHGVEQMIWMQQRHVSPNFALGEPFRPSDDVTDSEGSLGPSQRANQRSKQHEQNPKK